MVCIGAEYDNVRGLRKLLEEVKDERVVYEGTSETTLIEFAGFLMNAPESELDCEDKKYYCFLYQDFCLGQILAYDGNLEKQLEFYRLRKIVEGNDLEQLSHYLNSSKYFF